MPENNRDRLPPLPGEENFKPRTLDEVPDFPVDEAADDWVEDDDELDFSFGGGGGENNFRAEGSPLPIWSKFHQHENRTDFRLQVQRYNSVGEKEHIGHLPPDASHEALLNLGRRPGKYIVTPIDGLNQSIDDPQPISFADDHSFFRENGIETSRGFGGGGGSSVIAMPAAPDTAPLLNHLDKQEERALRERERYEETQREQLRRVEEQTRALHETQLEATRENSKATADLFREAAEAERLRQKEVSEQKNALYIQQERSQSRIHEQELARNSKASDRMQEQQSGFMAMMMQQMQMQAEQDRSRREDERRQERARMEADRLDRESRERADRERWERHMLLEKETQAARRQEEREELRRRDERRERETRESEVRRQEQNNLMMQLMQQKSENNSPLLGVTTALLAAKPLMDAVGVSPADLFSAAKNAISPEQKPGFMSEVGETVRELIRAAAGGGIDPAMFMPTPGEVPPQLPLTEEPPPVDLGPPRMQLPPPPDNGGQQQVASIPPSMMSNPPQIEGAHPAILQGLPKADYAPMEDTAPIPEAPVFHMDPSEKKKARLALAELVTSYEETPEEQRIIEVGKRFGESGQLFVQFFREATVRDALRQAGASDATVEAIVKALDSVGLDASLDRG